MKQTAVEWLFEKIWNTDKDKFTWYAILKQAKEIEKEQIFDAYITSHISMMSADQYYYETFKNKKMKQIVYNSVKCLECNEVLVSRHRHDYVTCGCPNDAMADGGNEYGRYGAMDMTKIQTYYVYEDDDYELVRQHATRGSRGKDGKQPLTWIAIADMDDDHLHAVLDYGGVDWHLDLIRKEIAYRDSLLTKKLDK